MYKYNVIFVTVVFFLFVSSIQAQKTDEELTECVRTKLSNSDWSVATKLDLKTGLATITVKPLSDRPIAVDLDSIFWVEDRMHFTWKWRDHRGVRLEDMGEISSYLAASVPGPMGTDQEIAKYGARKPRMVTLHKNESVSKEFYIWDVHGWETFATQVKKNNERALLYKSVSAEVDGNTIPCDLEIPIDVKAIPVIERLKKLHDAVEKKAALESD